MHSLQRFLVAVLVPALIVMIFAVSAVSAGGSDGKEEICHFANHKFVKISVSVNAEPAHMRHGDVKPDEYGDCGGDEDNGGSDEDNDGSDEHDGSDSDGQHESGDSEHGNHQHSDGGGDD
jgi:hypothetical protein